MFVTYEVDQLVCNNNNIEFNMRLIRNCDIMSNLCLSTGLTKNQAPWLKNE